MIERLISPKIQRTIERTGEIVLLIVAVSLALDYSKVFDLSKMQIPSLSIILWIWLLSNIALANMFKFWRTKDNPICPKCKRKLHELKEYECPKCGKLNFEVPT